MKWYQLDFKHEDTARLAAAALLVLGGGLLAGYFARWAGFAAAGFLAFTMLFALALHLTRRRERARIAQTQDVQHLTYLFGRIPFRAALPPLTGWAASPRLACLVYDLVRTSEPNCVLEIGSGASTLVTGYALEQNGHGRLLSLEHDAAYAEQVREDVAQHGLSHIVEVIHAPLAPIQSDGATGPWYHFDPAMHLNGQPVDLLVVDGPPHKTRSEARYPALPLLHPFLSGEAVVVLDDAARLDERRTVQRWEREFDFRVARRVLDGKGIAVLKRNTR